jgi:hypothetical protein
MHVAHSDMLPIYNCIIVWQLNNEDAAPISVDWHSVKSALLIDHTMVPAAPAVSRAVDRVLPPNVKYHAGHRAYYAICDDANLKVQFPVKDLGDELAFQSAVDGAKKLRVTRSFAHTQMLSTGRNVCVCVCVRARITVGTKRQCTVGHTAM